MKSELTSVEECRDEESESNESHGIEDVEDGDDGPVTAFVDGSIGRNRSHTNYDDNYDGHYG